jgi:peptidoglycan/LPS O-acetylase OafA/YrhL
LKGKVSFEAYKNRKILGNKYFAFLACIVCLSVLGFLSYYPISAQRDPPSWSRIKSAIFVTLSRPLFLISIIILIKILLLNNYIFLKRQMSRRFWAYFSRISYEIYIIFPIVLGQFSSSMGYPLYLTYNEMIYQMIFSILGCIFIGSLVYLFIERPFE